MKSHERSLRPRYMNSETDLGEGSLIGRGSIPLREGKDVFAVFPLERRGNAAYDMEDMLNRGRDRRPDDIVGAQTKRATRVSRSARMCMSKLDRSGEQQKNG
jgi:hypothetical protein